MNEITMRKIQTIRELNSSINKLTREFERMIGVTEKMLGLIQDQNKRLDMAEARIKHLETRSSGANVVSKN